MNHKQHSTLHALSAHPASSDIEPRLAYSMLAPLVPERAAGMATSR